MSDTFIAVVPVYAEEITLDDIRETLFDGWHTSLKDSGGTPVGAFNTHGRASRPSSIRRLRRLRRHQIGRAHLPRRPLGRSCDGPRHPPLSGAVLYVVHGPPCSGKSTHVREHAQPGDIIIDFDAIAQALGSPHPHNHPGPVRHVTIMARRAAITAALTVCQRTTVWIEATTLTATDLATYRQAGAVFVKTGAGTTKAELHQRARHQRPALWHRLIDGWTEAPGLDDTLGSRDW